MFRRLTCEEVVPSARSLQDLADAGPDDSTISLRQCCGPSLDCYRRSGSSTCFASGNILSMEHVLLC